MYGSSQFVRKMMAAEDLQKHACTYYEEYFLQSSHIQGSLVGQLGRDFFGAGGGQC